MLKQSSIQNRGLCFLVLEVQGRSCANHYSLMVIEVVAPGKGISEVAVYIRVYLSAPGVVAVYNIIVIYLFVESVFSP